MNESAYKGPRDPINAPCNQPCDHQWTDYGTLKSGDNPKIEIEACVRCGVQRKKQPQEDYMASAKALEAHKRRWAQQPQEWTATSVMEIAQLSIDGHAVAFREAYQRIADALNAALAAAYEKGRKDELESIRHMHEG